MKKFIFSAFLSIMFICTWCSMAFATRINMIEITDLDYPYLNKAVDRDVTIKRGYSSVKDVIWYKDGVKFYGDTFTEKGNYSCRVYLIPDEGFEHQNSAVITANTEDVSTGEDLMGYFCELKYYVDEEKEKYPSEISFVDFERPKLGEYISSKMTSEAPKYYNYTKVEWYYNNELLQGNSKAKVGEYTCRIYLEFFNGFEINSKVVGVLDGKKADKITRDHTGIYFDVVFTVGEKQDTKAVSFIYVSLSEEPYYGQALEKISVNKSARSNLYEIGDIVWYRDNFRMLDKYFYDGVYTCRIYINFLDGAYPSNELRIQVNSDSTSNQLKMMNNQYYIERNYTIKKYTVSKFQFTELNVPEYGSVQDTKITSLEPGIYSPSMVYWYDKKGKYMSNIETFGEGEYTCKFSLTLNVDCNISSKLTATIGGEDAKVYFENGKYTVEKTYEIKKPTKKWSKASDWAVSELSNALDYALIPTLLNGKDFTQTITRAEFAATAVRLYESISMKSAEATTQNPFTDTTDSEILKAYALGITNGTSDTTFDPNSLITRQEMATMMTRALEKAKISTDVNLNKVNKFTDHDKIEDWALNGVYFMSNLGIIKGKGNNTFDVLGSATREEAIAVSVRSVNYYK